MACIRLISEDLPTYTFEPSTNSLKKSVGFAMPRPEGKQVFVFFLKHGDTEQDSKKLMQYTINLGFGIVCVYDELPKNLIKHPNICYIETTDKWMLHSLFINPLSFSAVHASPK
jgi:hypothetical protein